MNAKLSASTGDASPAPMRFFSYKDPEENSREQIKKVRSHPWIAKDVPVRGFIFDVDTGRLHEVKVLEHERAAWPAMTFRRSPTAQFLLPPRRKIINATAEMQLAFAFLKKFLKSPQENLGIATTPRGPAPNI